ncbi:amidohydrolase family protein [Actinoplanes sp. NBRC 103695]|uniref:amidohydrolase family protein n=1 Tax=Actinoplanes sp. NBRC 103695 TaxID=3032202 RepID=UPI0024A2A672|nr:amidohydrolase family protein [Actinoplanes sp. NBRC 103695]GLY93942.1 cytosine deaminase [Actinoplanes sp. NBRC 103695]
MEIFDRSVPGQWTPGRTVVFKGASVITMDPGAGDFVGDVVVTGSTIAAAGPDAASTAPGDALVIDATGTVITPGLVDGHVHAWEGALRGVSPDSDIMAYLNLTHTVLAPLMTPDDVAVGETITAVRALEQGVTTIVDNSHNVRGLEHGQAVIGALQAAGLRAVVAVGVGMGQPDGHVRKTVLELRDFCATDPRLSVRLMELLPSQAGLRFAAENGIGLVAETIAGMGDLDEALTPELLNPQVTLDHVIGLSDAHWRAIAESGAAVALVPRSDPHYGLAAAAPVLTANRFGVQEAVSTDNEFEYGSDILGELRTLLGAQRGQAYAAARAGDADAPRPYGVRDALRAATVGGALAAGLAGQIGVLAPGAKADLTVFSLNRLRPIASHLGAVVSYAESQDVAAVVVDGVPRKWAGEVLGVDRQDLARRAEASRDRLLRQIGVDVDSLRFAGSLELPGVR